MPLTVFRTGAALFAVSLLAACSGADTGPAGETGGTMVIVLPAEPKTLFPPRANQSQELAVVASVFDRLAEIGPALGTFGDAGFTPRLATRLDLGAGFTVDRVRASIRAPAGTTARRYAPRTCATRSMCTRPTRSLSEARSLLGNIDSVTVRDSLTAVFWFKRRTPQQFMDATYSMFILPSHLLASLPDSALVNAPFGRQPVGTGRFRFAKWDAGSRLEIIADTANPRGRATLDRVIWTFVADLGAATVKLFAGEADFLEKIKPENIPQVASTPTLRLASNLPLAYGFVGFNLRARRSAPGTGAAPHPVFGDLRVRRALAMALDRDAHGARRARLAGHGGPRSGTARAHSRHHGAAPAPL